VLGQRKRRFNFKMGKIGDSQQMAGFEDRWPFGCRAHQSRCIGKGRGERK
jgi:hypothetical protein